MTFRVSVVIPTFRRHELLNRCLAALVAQDLDSSAYEVIVADDAASDETRRLVDDVAMDARESGHTLRYVAVTGAHGPAAARNAGWRAASSEIIAFIDDDCVPTINWLRAGVSAFTGEVVGIAGKIVIP